MESKNFKYKKLVRAHAWTVLIGFLITVVGFSAVIAKPPVERIPSDDDWAGAGTGVTYNYYLDDYVGIGTDSPSTELEVDGVITASGGDSNDWNTAFGWGDHAVAGYLTSYTETDPVFSSSAALGITGTQITNWNTAFGWGDHAVAGYDTTDDPWRVSGPDAYIASGNVGIGTSSPQAALHVNNIVLLEPRASAPSNPTAGMLYYNSAINKLMCYDGTTWQECW